MFISVIYEVFSGRKNFDFGRQPDPIAGTGIVSFKYFY